MVLEEHQQVKELIRFQLAYNRSTMRSTWVIAFFILLIFILEEFFGGSKNIYVLLSMGANVGQLVRQGEYYRLLSSVFLHAGYLHVFFNTYVLFALGGFFNRILGESKFICIFLASGISGSIASIFLGKAQVSVGASGALWGLFGASLALAFFRTDYLPEPMRLRLRRVAAINLLINLGVSFLPMVDIWAHLGGGVGGFLVSCLLIIRSSSKKGTYFKNGLFLLCALILSILYVTAFVYGVSHYKPWTIKPA